MSKRKIFDTSLFSLQTTEGKLNLFVLTLPLFLQLISGVLIGMIQTSFVAHYEGGFFVTAIGFGNSAWGLASTTIQMIPLGLAIILSVYLGQERSREEQADLTGTAVLTMAALTSLFCGLLIIFAEPVLKLFGMNGAEYTQLLPHAVRYLRIRLLGEIVASWYQPLAQALNCHGKTAVNLVATLSSSLLSVLFTYLCLYVFCVPSDMVMLSLGLCALGANVVHALLIALYYAVKRYPFRFVWRWKQAIQLFKLGVPASIANIVYSLSTNLTGTAIASLGINAYDTKQFVSQTVQFVYYFGFSLAKAGSIMMGRMYGMGEKEKIDKMFRQTLIIVLASNTLLSGIMFALYRPLLTFFYAANDEILNIAFLVYAIDMIVEFGRGANHVGQNSLNALGDVKFTTIVSIASCLAISVGLSFLFVFAFGWGLWSIWIAFACDELIRASLYLIRWKKGKWKTKLAIK